MQQKKRSLNNQSTIVGPTIKANSRLSAYFPDISRTAIHNHMDVVDEGQLEPLIRSK